MGLFIQADSVLLSHRETLYYHRRNMVSLLSSEWIRWFPYAMAIIHKFKLGIILVNYLDLK